MDIQKLRPTYSQWRAPRASIPEGRARATAAPAPLCNAAKQLAKPPKGKGGPLWQQFYNDAVAKGHPLPEKLADTLLRSREHTQELEAKRHKTLATTHVPKPSETAVAAKPAKAARVVHPSLICKATCLNGSQCKHRSTRGNYCSKHAPEQNVDTV